MGSYVGHRLKNMLRLNSNIKIAKIADWNSGNQVGCEGLIAEKLVKNPNFPRHFNSSNINVAKQIPGKSGIMDSTGNHWLRRTWTAQNMMLERTGNICSSVITCRSRPSTIVVTIEFIECPITWISMRRQIKQMKITKHCVICMAWSNKRFLHNGFSMTSSNIINSGLSGSSNFTVKSLHPHFDRIWATKSKVKNRQWNWWKSPALCCNCTEKEHDLSKWGTELLYVHEPLTGQGDA